MKNIPSISLFLLGFLLYSCNQAQTKSAGRNTIIGKWKLTESLTDIGDGKGQWAPVPPSDSTSVQFNENGTIESLESGFKAVKSYKIIDSAKMELTFQNNQPKINYRYKVQNDSLELNPPCIEACGFKYVKVE